MHNHYRNAQQGIEKPTGAPVSLLMIFPLTTGPSTSGGNSKAGF
jgi:hypothetical protein